MKKFITTTALVLLFSTSGFAAAADKAHNSQTTTKTSRPVQKASSVSKEKESWFSNRIVTSAATAAKVAEYVGPSILCNSHTENLLGKDANCTKNVQSFFKNIAIILAGTEIVRQVSHLGNERGEIDITSLFSNKNVSVSASL